MTITDQVLENSQECFADHPELKPNLVLWREDEEIIYTNDFSDMEDENNHGHDHSHGHSHGHGGTCTIDHSHDASDAGTFALDGHDHSVNHANGHDHGHSHGHGGTCTIDHGHAEAGSHAAGSHDHSHSHNHNQPATQPSANIGTSETDEISKRVTFELDRLRKEKDSRLRQLEEEQKKTESNDAEKQRLEDEIQRRADEEVRKLRAAEDREREARQAVEVQRKLAEEAQQRAAEMKRSLATEMKRSVDLADEMASTERLEKARELAREKQLEYEEKHRAAKKLQDDLLARVDTDIRTIIDQVRASRPEGDSTTNDGASTSQSLPPPSPVAEIITITHTVPGPLGLRLDTFSLTTTNGSDTTTKLAVQIKDTSKIPQIEAGDILLSINNEGPLLVSSSLNSTEYLQSVVAKLAGRPLTLSIFRCPLLSVCNEKGLSQATLTAEESSVLLFNAGQSINGSTTWKDSNSVIIIFFTLSYLDFSP